MISIGASTGTGLQNVATYITYIYMDNILKLTKRLGLFCTNPCSKGTASFKHCVYRLDKVCHT